MKLSGIYQIRNLINNHFYIGQSTNLSKRKGYHFSRLRNIVHENPYLQNSFNKYGEENFIFEILLICEISELTYYEQKYFDILKPEYNIRKECIDSNKGLKHSESAIQKISEASKRSMSDPDVIAKISKSNTGKVHSEETRKKLSEINTGRVFTEDHKKKISDSLKNKSSYEKRIVSEITRKKMSDAQKGKPSPMKGKHHTEESKLKMKEKRNNRNKK
jgi:group I intron endonuclease